MFKRKILPIILLLSVIIVSSQKISFINNTLSYYVNLQLVLIFLFVISDENINFNRGLSLFILAIVNDSLNGLFFGSSVIIFFIIYGLANYQKNIKVRTIFLSEWIMFSVSLTISYVVFILIQYLSNNNIFYKTLLINYVFTVLIYPMFWIIFHKLIYKNN